MDGDGDFVARRTGPRLPPAVKRPAAKLQASLQKSRVSKNRIYKNIYRSVKKIVGVFRGKASVLYWDLDADCLENPLQSLFARVSAGSA